MPLGLRPGGFLFLHPATTYYFQLHSDICEKSRNIGFAESSFVLSPLCYVIKPTGRLRNEMEKESVSFVAERGNKKQNLLFVLHFAHLFVTLHPQNHIIRYIAT